MAKKTLAPQQERSRESLRKLQKATAEVLGQHGVEGTTIPRIAQHAGLTPGAIYRRFHDKDALLEATILGILERQEERMKTSLTPGRRRADPAAGFCRTGDRRHGAELSRQRISAARHADVRSGPGQYSFLEKGLQVGESASFEHVVEFFWPTAKKSSIPIRAPRYPWPS